MAYVILGIAAAVIGRSLLLFFFLVIAPGILFSPKLWLPPSQISTWLVNNPGRLTFVF